VIDHEKPVAIALSPDHLNAIPLNFEGLAVESGAGKSPALKVSVKTRWVS